MILTNNNKKMNNKLITWTNFYETNDQLIEQILESKKQYTFILAITRGGLFPAYFIAKKLNIPVETINLTSYKDQQAGKIEHVTVEGFSNNVINPEKCLLVDDIFDSGKTIQYLQEQYPGMDSACTYARWNNHSLTYVGSVLDYETWIDFPWEVKFNGHEKLSEPM